MKDLLMQFVDDKIMVPIYFAVFLGSLVFWANGIDKSSKDHDDQIKAIKKAMETNHKENVENMNQIQKLLNDINKSIGVVEGKVSVIERQVKQ